MRTNVLQGIAACLFAWSGLVAASASPWQLKQAPPASGDDSAAQLDQVANMQCAPGLERFLPGVYYYCVGARDLARHRDDRARQMLELAAAWGSKPAQLTLGVGYYNGDGSPMNRPLGLAWLGLAAERREPAYVAIFKSAWDKASPQEQARAQALWQSMRPTYGDARAAHRAEQRYRRMRSELVSNDVYGAQTCIAGITTTVVVRDGASCYGATSPTFAARKLDTYADGLFEGWSGHVSVGPLEQVPAPKH